MPKAIRWCCLVYISALFLTGCVVPIPPQVISISEVPIVSGTLCNVTFVRKQQFAGSAPSHFISLDKLIVAALEVGEYTTFPVSAGRHSLAVTWRVGDRIVGGGGVGALMWSPYAKLAEVDCRPPEDYLFTITLRAFGIDENDRVVLRQVEQLEGDFVLDRNSYVPPGPR